MCRTGRNNEVCFESLEEALAQSPETYGHLDLIAFGFPCQDLSIANPKGKGLKGNKSSIFFQCMRIVRLLVPQWILIENVPGLLTSNRGMDMRIVLNEMAKCGYGWTYRVLDARYFGSPQRRRRIFIVGLLGAVPPPEILFEPEGYKRNVPKNDKTPSECFCINARTGSRQDRSVETFIAKTINTGQRGNNYAWRENYVASTIDCGRATNSSAERKTYIASTITQNRGIHNARNDTLIARCINTQRRGGSFATQENYVAEPHAGGKRKASRVSRGLDTARGIVIGNAVNVNVAEWIGKRIMEYNCDELSKVWL
jgi:DNA (cytosine-5)-methyltransferase 1